MMWVWLKPHCADTLLSCLHRSELLVKNTDKWSFGVKAGLKQFSDLNANVGTHIEINMVAAVQRMKRIDTLVNSASPAGDTYVQYYNIV